MYHDLIEKEVFEHVKSSEAGLTSQEAAKRLEEHGHNELTQKKQDTWYKILAAQFKSPLVWILIAAMLVSLIEHHLLEFYIIGAIVIINALIGFKQEYNAEKAIEHLKKLISLKAKVLRDGKEVFVEARDLVPGDVILIETGDKIPADARIFELSNLKTQEAALTGESASVTKKLGKVEAHAALGDRKNTLYSGTIVTGGHCKAVIVSTGMATEIGKIAKLLDETKPEPTPLQRKLGQLGKFIGIAVIVMALIIFGLGILKGSEPFEMFLIAIAIAVAAIPEGLPAVVTMSLSRGLQSLASKNALMRKLPTTETLGACSVICSDKTGTLTHNQMTVKKLFTNMEVVSVSGEGYEMKGEFSKDPKNYELLLNIGLLCNNAKIEKDIIGDPTEAALIVSAAKAGIVKENAEKDYPRIKEIEFTSERKMMTTVHQQSNKRLAFSKGAPDVLINKCTYMLHNGTKVRMGKSEKDAILQANKSFADDAIRVLAFAYKELEGETEDAKIESDMIFVGLQGMIDPPRKEVKKAIERCHEAGIRVIMITGDHIDTAKAIAKELGITGEAITGHEIGHSENLHQEVEHIGVFARVNPEHKLKIVDALKANKHVVAMTGDGVNDAPALKKADIGIAMGIAGTDVAKESADMILTDDNFASIVKAIEEGRTIFDNIKNVVEYLLSSNMGEVLTLLAAILLGLPLPLVALQILWINLVTDSGPAITLGYEPSAPGIMKRKPRKTDEKILNKYRAVMMYLIGGVMMIGTLSLFAAYNSFSTLVYAQTMAFTTLVMFQLFNAFNQRSENQSVFTIGLFTNWKLVLSIVGSLALQFVVLYVPYFQTAFGTVGLSGIDWLWAVLMGSSVLVLGEVIKKVRRKAYA